MKLDKIKLKWKIFGYVLAFAAIIIMIFCFFQIFMLEGMYKKTKINSVEELFKDTALKVSSTNDFSDPFVIDSFRTLATDKETAIYLYDLNGSEVLAVNNGDYYKDFSDDKTFKDIVDKAMISSPVKRFYIIFENSLPAPGNMDYPAITNEPISSVDSSIICAQFIEVLGTKMMLILDARLAPVEPAVKTLTHQLFYISIIVVILAVVVALVISLIISKPIKKMNDSAKLLATGKRDITFEGGGFEEIVELNNTLNYAVSELNKTENLQKELLSNISHDLKTPITLISGYAEMMKDYQEENTPENLKLIIDECNRLNVLVNDLLNLSRLQAHTETFTNEEFNLTSLISEIISRQQKFLESNHFTLSFKYNENVKVNSDSKKLSQVIYNFITNAVNYSTDKKEIIVSQEVKGDVVRISVKDFGIGIKEEEIDLIWNRYYRIDKTYQRTHEGSGIGLAIVKEILDHYGYHYGVTSTYGSGSTFYFEIPILK